ncbi:hypothetical protein E2C01_043589 [Portunus trituberculatus]|uniref:Uncharacterized protein n=1 Tax=Portunus trituberculatus TaxID=210409 RepID=A0A5B7FWS2_PORTR|nr:hypothetical protein [Portunus trituberculatus]
MLAARCSRHNETSHQPLSPPPDLTTQTSSSSSSSNPVRGCLSQGGGAPSDRKIYSTLIFSANPPQRQVSQGEHYEAYGEAFMNPSQEPPAAS